MPIMPITKTIYCLNEKCGDFIVQISMKEFVPCHPLEVAPKGYRQYISQATCGKCHFIVNYVNSGCVEE